MVKRLPTMWETWVQSLGQEFPLEKEMATHSSTHTWKIAWTEESGRLQSMRLQRVGHDWATSLHFTSPDQHSCPESIQSLPTETYTHIWLPRNPDWTRKRDFRQTPAWRAQHFWPSHNSIYHEHTLHVLYTLDIRCRSLWSNPEWKKGTLSRNETNK